MQETKTVDNEFRLWVSVQPHPQIPSSLLQSAIKIVADSPKVSVYLSVFCVVFSGFLYVSWD